MYKTFLHATVPWLMDLVNGYAMDHMAPKGYFMKRVNPPYVYNESYFACTVYFGKDE